MAFDPNLHRLNFLQELQSGLQVANWGGVYPTAYFTEQADHIWSLGLRKLRGAAPGLNSFTVNSVVPHMKTTLEIYADQGFDLDWGACIEGLTDPTKIDYWWNAIEPIAQWFQTFSESYPTQVFRLMIANENEADWNQNTNWTAPSITRASNVVTVEYGVTHHLQTGDQIVVTTKGSFTGGTFTITGTPTTTSVTYAQTGADDTNTLIKTYHKAQTVCNIIKRKATAIRALTSPAVSLDLVVSVSQGKSASNSYTYYMIQGGLGDVTAVHLNLYGEGGNTTLTFADFQTELTDYINLVGLPNAELTEVGLYSDDQDNNVVPRTESSYLTAWRNRFNHLATLGIPYYLFAFCMPDNSNRLHLSMIRPERYTNGREHQPIFDEWLGQAQTAQMLPAWQDATDKFRYSLVKNIYHTGSPYPDTDGYLYIPGHANGFARKLTSAYSFQRSKSYGIMGWVKMIYDATHTVNTLWRFGDSSTNGYRILLERSGSTWYLKVQDQRTFSTETMTIPLTVNVTDWVHIAVTWAYNSATGGWLPYFYVNGRLLNVTNTSLAYSSLTEKFNGSILLGTDYNVQTMYGYMRDWMYFERLLQPDDIWRAIKDRYYGDALSYWPLDGAGTQAVDIINQQHLTLSGTNTALYTAPIDLTLPTDINIVRGRIPYIIMPGNAGGDARNTLSGLDFLRTSSYTVMGWARMIDLTAHPVNVLFRFGDSGSNGYRVLFEKSGSLNYLKFQDSKTFSSESAPMPTNLTPTDWFHWCIAWTGDDTTWSSNFYINSIEIKPRSDTILFSAMTEKINGAVFLGTDYNVQTHYGHQHDVRLYTSHLAQAQIYTAMINQSTTGMALRWLLNDGRGTTAIESVSGKNLTLTGATEFSTLVSARNGWLTSNAPSWLVKGRYWKR